VVTKRAAVLGSPIAHSLSPALHRAAYGALGLDWVYDAIEVTEEQLPAFMAGLDETWAGLSLTMPLKAAVIPLLDQVDETAARINAVNTVIPGASGWHGVNTDVFGIVRALRERGVATPVTASVLGGGATARSAIAALAELKVSHVSVIARRPDAAAAIVDLAQALGLTAVAVSFEPSAPPMGVDVVISTLPGEAASGWAAVVGAATGVLLEAAYHPWPTPLAAAWPNSSIASGRDMLLWQAVRQVELMTGLTAPVSAMASALPALNAE
jgi:shikimate dehydrogenase